MARELAVIRSTADVLGWDQETYLPPTAARYRADQLSWLSARAHELATSGEWRDALALAEQQDQGDDPLLGANLRRMRKDSDRAARIPVELVARETEASSLAKHAWADARQRSDFSLFAPHLETLVQIAREKAGLWGFSGEPYDALLEGYESGATTAEVASLFEGMTHALREISAAAVEKSAANPVALPDGPYPIAGQKKFNARIAESIGFDFSAGRIDTTAHPFCTTLGPADVRLTTRYNERDFTSSLLGVLHEAGHGMYEQGLPASDFGLPSGSAASLGIHESQSRLWENHVGRSAAFWETWYPVACETFPQLTAMPPEKFLRYLHRAAFSPIRVEADEATYDLHILLRFAIERRLISGEIEVKEVPAIWNEMFRASFGFSPPDDARGCLQDIHWSMGGLGYFPTYTLGNIHAARLFAAANENAEISAATRRANYAPLLGWLRENIHARGATMDSPQLIEAATGSPPTTTHYLTHLRNTYL
ncbi:MAG: carboxypeptidase M32 [Verrucomicrobiota bacterium]